MTKTIEKEDFLYFPFSDSYIKSIKEEIAEKHPDIIIDISEEKIIITGSKKGVDFSLLVIGFAWGDQRNGR